MQIVPATTAEHYEAARVLFIEYAADLGHDLCFQHFQTELATLPGAYAPPAGALLLARDDETWAGCIAVRPQDTAAAACEMKRLYVRPAYRGRGLGRQLAAAVIAAGRSAGYRCMRLDTLADMRAARALYEALGFREIPAYYYNPIPDAVYYELDLTAASC